MEDASHLLTWAPPQVGGYLRYTSRDAKVIAKAAHDPDRKWEGLGFLSAGCKRHNARDRKPRHRRNSLVDCGAASKCCLIASVTGGLYDLDRLIIEVAAGTRSEQLDLDEPGIDTEYRRRRHSCGALHANMRVTPVRSHHPLAVSGTREDDAPVDDG
jgi:hypothetical protein